ncbi:PTS sugar transporter subunit IIB [Helcococcus kunzii]|uniref:PTS sugar transporter subunit IIB n=1 Tax=Helcococcus kunzii TaxID=40091 RepID=UPI0024ACF819|nr:PTS sugar transporter subunit IIB [Helcococcus kunzii]
MILLTRVDHRLLHGQVTFSWTSSLSADAILIASDNVVKNEMWKTTLKLAKPSGVKLVIKSINDAIDNLTSGVTDKYRLIIITETIKDAKKLIDSVDNIKELNLGGAKKTQNSKQIGKSFYIDKEDEVILEELINKGIEIDIRQLASESKKLVKNLL